MVHPNVGALHALFIASAVLLSATLLAPHHTHTQPAPRPRRPRHRSEAARHHRSEAARLDGVSSPLASDGAVRPSETLTPPELHLQPSQVRLRSLQLREAAACADRVEPASEESSRAGEAAVVISARATYRGREEAGLRGSWGDGLHSYAVHFTVRNEGAPLKLLSRHLVYTAANGSTFELHSPGDGRHLLLIESGEDVSFSTISALPTRRGALAGSLQFAVLLAADDAASRSTQHGFSAHIGRVALSPEARAEIVPCGTPAPGLLPSSSLHSTEGVLIAIKTAFLQGASDPDARRFVFMLDVTIANGRSAPVSILALNLLFIDTLGAKRAFRASVLGNGGHGTLRLSPGRMSRLENSVVMQTPTAMLRGELLGSLSGSDAPETPDVFEVAPTGLSVGGESVESLESLGFLSAAATPVEILGPLRA